MNAPPSKSQDPSHTPTRRHRARAGVGSAFFEGKHDTIQTQNDPFSTPQSEDGSFFQPKLNIHPAYDVYEAEAERMADRVVDRAPAAPVIAPPVQRQAETEEAVQEKPLINEISRLPADTAAAAQRMPAFFSAGEMEQNSAGQGDVQSKSAGAWKDTTLQRREEDEVQTQTSADAQARSEALAPAPGFEQRLQSTKGGGSALPAGTRRQMESGFGADFSGVRTHTGPDAVQMSRNIGARAFTHGNDIYFNQGEYQPGTRTGDHLLAHELTHTVQQGAATSVQQKTVQREGDDTAVVPQTGDNYDFVSDPPKIFIDNLPIPTFKENFMSDDDNFRAREFSNGGREGENDPDQAGEWDKISSNGALNELLQGGLQNDRLYRVSATVNSGGQTKRFERNGDANLLAQNLKVPFWDDSTGEKEIYEIDHKQELQLKGWPRTKNAGALDNLHLLSKEANRASGDLIKTNVNTALSDLIRTDQPLRNALASKDIDITGINQRLIDRIKSRFDIHYRDFSPASDPSGIKTWDKAKIESGSHIEKLLTRQKGRGSINFYDFQDPNPNDSLPFDPHPANLDIANQIGSSSAYVLYWGDNLGSKSKISWEDPGAITKNLSTNMFDPRLTMHGKFFNAESMEFNPQISDGQKGHLRGKPFKLRGAKGNRSLLVLPEYFNWPIYKMPGTIYAGFLKSEDLKNFINNSEAQFTSLSPFTINSIHIGPEGLLGVGTLMPSVPFISRANIEIILTEDDIRLQKTFSSGDLNMPAPFNVSDVSLILGYGIQNGFFIEGRVNFGIEHVGEGYIGATASTSGGFELEGAFNFDSELFDPAEISVEYKDNIWTIGGRIGITEGKIRGIKSATITARYSENTFSAEGVAELDIPGIERGSMSVVYGEEGFSIEGNFEISGDVPGIRGGNVHARVSKTSGEETYNVLVTGTAQPDIPGINSTLTVTYDNGALTITGSASYNRGMLSGTVNVGATNRAIGDDGQPTGDPDDTIRVYGGGTLTLQLTPWLAATAGVKFLPNGEMEVTARLSTDTYTVFARKEYDRNLFTVPTIEIPLFAIPLGPRSVGLVAQIGGGLDFKAGFGPGQLKNLSAEITYNPDHEENTTVRGHGEFVIPADAGLVLRGNLSLGVSVAIASLTGGIELAGTLGLQGEAGAAVDVNWSPQTGLTLDASGRIMVSPRFTFDINAFARASLGVGVFSISKTWRHNLASYTWGPDIQFGIVFPVHYREGETFNMSFDDIQVIYPDIQIIEMSKGLAQDIKNDIFD